MKFALLLSILCFSSVSFSQELTKIDEVIGAIKDSLANKDLECHDSISGRIFKASALNFDAITILKSTISINESQQPVITFSSENSLQSIIVEISTNSDQTIVEKIKIANNDIETKRKNVGTITNPRYEQVISKKLTESVECK